MTDSDHWTPPVPELAFLPSKMPHPLCDFCWAREMADFDPGQFHREHGDPPIMAIGYLEDTGNFEEAIGLCEEHLRALKTFVRGLKWEEPANAK